MAFYVLNSSKTIWSNIFVLDTSDNTVGFLTSNEYKQYKNDLKINKFLPYMDLHKLDFRYKKGSLNEKIVSHKFFELRIKKYSGSDKHELRLLTAHNFLTIVTDVYDGDSFVWNLSNGEASYEIPSAYAGYLFTSKDTNEISKILSHTWVNVNGNVSKGVIEAAKLLE